MTELTILLLAALAAWLAYAVIGRLHTRQQLAETALESIHDAVITTDRRNLIDYLNPMAEQLTGWSRDDARGQPLGAVFRLARDDAQDAPAHPAVMTLLNEPVADMEGHTVLVRKDGLAVPIENSAAPIRGAADEVRGNVLVFRDVTETRDLARQLLWQSRHDRLTGLDNRQSFEHAIDDALRTAKGDVQHVLVYIDLDHFGIVNDSHGYAAGDELLRNLAGMLRQHVRRSDRIARIGGDEFAVLLHECSLEVGGRIAALLCEQIRDFRIAAGEVRYGVSASAGLVPIGSTYTSGAQVLSLGDAACNVAKDNGGDRIQEYFGGKACTRKHQEMLWLRRIDKALADDRFSLFFQTIAPLAAGDRIARHELLLRMHGEDGALIGPMNFIPAAEKHGLMTQVDRWVVSYTLRWLAAHPAAATDRMWGINLSGQSLSDDRFLRFLTQALDDTALAGQCLCFEITETAAIADIQRAQQLIHELKRRQCLVALDDFGSGMSSYTYLKNLAVDFIKIDGGFVQNIVHDTTDRVMVESINRIGHTIGLCTIAESVEDRATAEVLRALGVDYAQGFGVHKPQPLAEFHA